ncbi:MAG: hypothetical protein KC519_21940 [Anaerolineae bacterium]|nr:hypothetical protein [Anaerolineae bacterium]
MLPPRKHRSFLPCSLTILSVLFGIAYFLVFVGSAWEFRDPNDFPVFSPALRFLITFGSIANALVILGAIGYLASKTNQKYRKSWPKRRARIFLSGLLFGMAFNILGAAILTDSDFLLNLGTEALGIVLTFLLVGWFWTSFGLGDDVTKNDNIRQEMNLIRAELRSLRRANSPSKRSTLSTQRNKIIRT